VKPPHVAASPVALESRLHSMLLRPLCRLGRNEWGTIDEVMRVRRIPYAEWPGTPDIS